VDVAASLSVERGKLSVSRLAFGTANGFSAEIDGELNGLAVPAAAGKPAQPSDRKGTLRFIVGAPTQAAFEDLTSYIDVPEI
ncbi:hypothetical protein ACSTK4_23600, partial [Vibrio parahaemolyticus]